MYIIYICTYTNTCGEMCTAWGNIGARSTDIIIIIIIIDIIHEYLYRMGTSV